MEKRTYWKLRLTSKMHESIQALLNFPGHQYIIFMWLSRVDNSRNPDENRASDF